MSKYRIALWLATCSRYIPSFKRFLNVVHMLMLLLFHVIAATRNK